MDEQKPGQVITPGATAQPAPSPAPVLAPAPSAQPVDEPAEPFTEEDAAKYQTPAQFVDEVPQATSQIDSSISWSASEYIAHHKSGIWYLLFGLAVVIGLAAIYFMTDGDILSVVVVATVAAVFAIYASRQPNEQQYSISEQGVTIGNKAYSFNDFKSFSVIDEGAFSSIAFMPLKRFMPVISIYYDPEDEEKIIDTLGQFLPFDHSDADMVDRFMKKIRF
jgi:hypothetical protein